MAAKKWAEYPEHMVRKQAMEKALMELAPKRKRGKRQKSPFVPAPGKRLTDHQIDFLRMVHRLTRKLGRAPSAQDVADETGLTRLGARRMLKALETHGLLEDKPVIVSSGKWTVTDAARPLLEEE